MCTHTGRHCNCIVICMSSTSSRIIPLSSHSLMFNLLKKEFDACFKGSRSVSRDARQRTLETAAPLVSCYKFIHISPASSGDKLFKMLVNGKHQATAHFWRELLPIVVRRRTAVAIVVIVTCVTGGLDTTFRCHHKSHGASVTRHCARQLDAQGTLPSPCRQQLQQAHGRLYELHLGP